MSSSDNTLLRVDALTISFGSGFTRKAAVSNVSLSIDKGGALGLIGESGCGKSTVLRAIAGLNNDYEGRIRFVDQDVPAKRSRDMFRRMQMVFQDPYASLHPRKTVYRILSEPLIIHGFDRRSERVDEVLEAVGLSSAFRYRYPHQLSGGQRQRIAIARALIVEPDVLLLDEPTSALDVSVQAEVLNLLKSLRVQRSLTYLMVSHDLAVISHICDRIAVMNHGEILEKLSRKEVRQGSTKTEYGRTLFEASQGYVR
ncbi:ABC transporter ATP-binding protein [Brucella intermedia]|uniref:ABC transporter ATP-binding protein n=1 Tax=Brucella intermedia TaxID=94625 RepID=UPI00224B8EC7|nr:ABC transporter ATP-binding protein [Brucella intermedia]